MIKPERLNQLDIDTRWGFRSFEVWHGDITKLNFPINLLLIAQPGRYPVNVREAQNRTPLEWFGKKLRLMLTFAVDPAVAEYLLDEWPERLPYMARTPNPTIPVFVIRVVAARPQASRGAECGQTGA